MPSFEDRERGFERKFEQDQELAFKVRSRRRKLLGLWAAHELGLTDAEAESYAAELVSLGLHRGGDDEEIEHIARDFAKKGVTHDKACIALEATHCEREARKQLGVADV
jgi:hypothetical protein